MESSKLNFFPSVSIIIAGIIIAGAILFVGNKSPQPLAPGGGSQPDTAILDQMAAIDSTDHIRGNPDAPVTIVEYSDFECPYCKNFHTTMKTIIAEYGNQVAWVYRHFPLDNLHPKADKEAEASECAAEQGGNDAFWKFSDRLFEVTPSNDGLDPARLPVIAQDVDLNVQQFIECLASGKYAAHIESDFQNAMATGGQGTPWSIIVQKNGEKYSLSGALPYASVKQIIDRTLQDN